MARISSCSQFNIQPFHLPSPSHLIRKLSRYMTSLVLYTAPFQLQNEPGIGFALAEMHLMVSMPLWILRSKHTTLDLSTPGTGCQRRAIRSRI
jgi:hypothetical protein